MLTIDQTILDCSPRNVGFYNKCDYEEAGQEMCCYYDDEAKRLGV
jgi:glucosamine-phosphate N-acetyltransferase